MKTVTVDDIMNMNPCEDYTRERIEELRKSVCGRRKRITVQDVLNTDISNEDKAWLIFRIEFFTDEQLHKIGIYAAEKIALPIWLKHYPDDDRPANAIRVKKLWLKCKATDEELNMAWDAAISAANSAACSAAISAAISAANSAAWDAARYAAWDAACSAACSAAWDASWDKIFKYALRLAE